MAFSSSRANSHKGFEGYRAREIVLAVVYPGDGEFRRSVQQAIVRFPLKAREWKSREEASIILGISLETVKTHAKSILQKLGVQNTAGAVTRAFELGLLRA